MEVKVGHHTSNLKRGLSFALVPGSRKRALALAAAEAEAKAEAKRLALAVEEVERRVATDGGLFTKAEFIAFYKGIEEWDAADAVAREKRLAWVESADELESCPALRTSLRSYEDAVERDAHDFWALAALGEAYEVIDRVADAAAHYERALAVNPEAIETRLSLARTLRAMPGRDATTQHVVLEHLTLVTERTAAATLGQRVEALIERTSVMLADRDRPAGGTLALLRRTLALIDSALPSDVAQETSGGGDERLLVNAKVQAERRAAEWAPWRADVLRSIAFAQCQELVRSVGGGAVGGSFAPTLLATTQVGGLGEDEEARLEREVDAALRDASAATALATANASGLARLEGVVVQRYTSGIIGI